MEIYFKKHKNNKKKTNKTVQQKKTIDVDVTAHTQYLTFLFLMST